MGMLDIGTNKEIRSVFRMLSDDKKDNIDTFCLERLDWNYLEFNNADQIKTNINIGNIDNKNVNLIKTYSGYNFRNINNAMRDRWNYEENGHERFKQEYQELAYQLKEFIDSNQTSIGNVKAFRGVSLDYFKDYGIESLNDLVALKGQFLLDKGFVSTSLIEEESFYKKENELGINYNVKIEYMIPEEFEDGVYIGDSNLSYSPNQCEYLINAWNMAKVCEVDVTDEDVVVKAIMIPKKVYDDYYDKESRVIK